MSMSVTRRRLFNLASGAALAPAVLASAPTSVAARTKRAVIGLHQDRPFIDFTGEAERFTPSDGAHAGAAVARLTEEEFRRLNPFG